MTFGFGVLRHAPHTFWSMTPRELAAAAAPRAQGPAAPSRADMLRLLQEFPDVKGATHE